MSMHTTVFMGTVEHFRWAGIILDKKLPSKTFTSAFSHRWWIPEAFAANTLGIQREAKALLANSAAFKQLGSPGY